MCGAPPVSMEKPAVQEYVGDTVATSVDVRRMREMMHSINFLPFTPGGLPGIALPLAHHPSILVHVL